MPSTYAHYKFGITVLEKLNDTQLADRINKNKELFFIGLHGPDILFYYEPLRKNEVNSLGYEMHTKSAKDFFQRSKIIIKGKDRHGEYLSYILGFICHFILDSECHGYINKLSSESTVSHTKIEVEFDRMLLISEGKNPIKAKLTEHLKINSERAEIIAEIFDIVSAKEIMKAVKSMVTYNKLLVAPGKVKRNLIYSILKVTKSDQELKDHLISYVESEECAESNQVLMNKFNEAVGLAVDCIEEYNKFLFSDEALNEIFNRNYE